ncbi:MAG: hypothetical protein CMO61_01240 [Verrucomicrobiales bacterium]|nr:hypothetical protein [Verrucomicrobiales bacterium]
MKYGNGWHFIGIVGVCFGLSSCHLGSNKNKGGIPPLTGDATINTVGFLETDFEPLNMWLDEIFEVNYKHMTAELIFDQVPLNDIFYQTDSLSSITTPFNFSSPGITRRQLLKKISDHWKLRISLISDSTGNPTAVLVRG